MKNFPKCDLFWMIAVLDKFDQTLAEASSPPFLVEAILRFTKQLMDNSLNRSIYNSYEHLDALLHSKNMVLTCCTLDLLVRVAQRNNQQHGALSNFTKNLKVSSVKALVSFDYESETYQYYSEKEGRLVVLNKQSMTKEQEDAVPEEHSVSIYFWKQPKSQLLLQIRLLSLSVYIWMTSETQTSGFVDEPWVISLIQTYPEALVVIESLFSWRGRVNHLLGTLQIGASHGVLMFQLKNIAALPEGYVDALLSLVTTAAQLKEGGNFLVQAGLMQLLVSLLKENVDVRVSTRLVSLLDQIAYTNNVNNSFDNIVAADGFKVVADKVYQQLEYCLQYDQATLVEDQELKSPNLASDAIPHEHIALFKCLLRFMIHTMQSQGGNDRVRTLIDGPLVQVVKQVIQRPNVFGAVLYAMSINLMGAFIHNDPTSYSVLHEKGVPQAFAQSLMKFPISPSFDLLFAIPNAIGAVCLNSDGLKEVISINPFGRFFEVFLSADHLRAMLDEDVSSALGNSFDELTRHHPDLKPLIQQEIVLMLDKILAMSQVLADTTVGNSIKGTGLQLESGDPACELNVVEEAEVQKYEQSLQPLPIMNFIESISRFLMGYFTNEQHAKDLMTDQLVTRLVDLYTAQSLPHDFAASLSSYSLSNVLRITSSFQSQNLLHIIITRLLLVYQENLCWIDFNGQTSVFVSYIDSPTQQQQDQYRMFVRLHALLGLLCDVYSQPVFSQSNVILKVIEGFTDSGHSDVLKALCRIYGACALEIQFFRQEVCKELMGTEIDQKGLQEKSLIKKFADPTDYRVQNVRYFKYLLTQSTAFIVPVMQGLSKMLLNKRMDAELYRLPAHEGAQLIVKAALGLLNNERVPQDAGVVRFHYIQIAVGFCHTLCTDDRYVEHILTIIAAQFVKFNGLTVLLNLLEGLCSYLSKENDADVRVRGIAAIEVVLKLLRVFCDKKAVMESSHTTNLLAKDGQALRLGNKFDVLRPVFNPEEFLVANRYVVLNALYPIISNQKHVKIGTSNLQALYKLIASCLKSASSGDNSVVPGKKNFESVFFDRFDPYDRYTTADANRTFDALATQQLQPTPTPVQPAQAALNEAHVTQLMEMGFDRPSALNALQQTGRNVMRAADYLLTHPPFTPTEVASAPVPEANQAGPSISNSEAMETDDVDQALTDDGDENFEDVDETDEDEEGQEVTTDTDADMSFGAATALQSKKEHPADKKFRAEAEATLEQLVNVRRKYGDLIVSQGHTLIENSSSALQELKDVYVSISTASPELGQSFSKLNWFAQGGQLDSDDNAQSLASLLHFFALLFKEEAFAKSFKEGSMVQQAISLLTTLLTTPYSCSVDLYMLVLECLELVLEQAFVKQYAIVEAAEGEACKFVDSTALGKLSIEAVEAALKVLSLDKILNSQAVNCFVRLIAIATRNQEGARRFIELDGITKMLNSVKGVSFHGQTSLFIIIFRHVVELDEVLRLQFQQDMVNWFTTPRPKNAEMGTFIKNFASAICRDQYSFVDAVAEICRLNTAVKFSQITLVGRELAKKQLEDVPDKVEEYQQILKSNNAKVQALLLESQPVKQVVFELMDKLMEHRKLRDSSSSNLAAELPGKLESDVQYYHRCFALQALSELFGSFHPTKLIALSYCKSKSGKDKAGAYKGFKSFLLYLLNDLLPYKNLKVGDRSEMSPVEKNQIDQSNWVMHLFSILCSSDISEEATAQERRLSLSTTQLYDYMTLRKITVEMTVRSMKEALHSQLTLEQKYGRMYALVVLICKMLGVRFPPSPSTPANLYQESLTCRAMMEKNVVYILTNMLNEVDLNFPDSKILVDGILKPLEQLTRQANKLSKSSSLANSPKQSKSNLLEHVTGATQQTPLHLSDDFIRDSALGMFGSGGDVHHSSDSSDNSEDDADMMDEDEDDYDTVEEDGQDDFTDISEESMPEQDDLDSNIDMEVVIRTAPVDGIEGYSDDVDSDSDTTSTDLTNLDTNGEGNGIWMDEGPAEDEDEDGNEIIGEEHNVEVLHEDEDIARFQEMYPDSEDETDGTGEDEEDVPEFDDEGGPQFDDFDMDGGPEDFELIGNPWGRGGSAHRRHRRNNIPDYIRFAGQHEFGDLNDQELMGGLRQPMLVPSFGRGVGLDDASGTELTLNDNIGQNPLLARDSDRQDVRSRRLPSSVMNSDTRNAIQFLEQMLHVDARNMDIHINSRGAEAPVTDAPGNSTTARVNTECHPIRSSERWFQEARNIFGGQVNAQAANIQNTIVNRLLPFAKVTEVKRREAADKEKQERLEQSKKEAEEKRQKAEEQKREGNVVEVQAQVSTTVGGTAMDIDGQASTISGSQVTIHGTQLNLANSGIDLTFLEALPDDLRMDVIAQHLREQAASGNFQVPAELSQEFIAALPGDLRQYITEEHQFDMEEEGMEHPEDGRPEQQFFANLPPEMQDFFRQPFAGGQRSETTRSMEQRKVIKKLPSSPYKEPVQLLDQNAVMTLLRLMFSQNQDIRNNQLHALFQNLCENGNTRVELLDTLLSIVNECSRIGSRSKSTPKKSTSLLALTDNLLVGRTQEYRSVTAIERSLNLMLDLITKNELNAQFFLVENDSNNEGPQSPSVRRPSASKKHKQKYPLVSLLFFMDHKIFLHNSQLMELLTSLIAQVTRLIAQAASKAEVKNDGSSGEEKKDKPEEGSHDHSLLPQEGSNSQDQQEQP